MGSRRQEVSPEMREHPFVAGLTERLGGHLRFTTGALRAGELGADTVGPEGFSLRAYSRLSTNKNSVSVLNITGGRPFVYFSSKRKLQEYLPGHLNSVDRLAALVARRGGHLDRQWDEKTSISMADAISELDELSEIALDFASAVPRASLPAPIGSSTPPSGGASLNDFLAVEWHRELMAQALEALARAIRSGGVPVGTTQPTEEKKSLREVLEAALKMSQ